MDDFKITDLTGLSKPLEKLADVVSKGIGVLYEPKKIRDQAKAKVKEIELISDALESNDNLIISYKNEGLTITNEDLVKDKKALERMFIKEKKKQENIDDIIICAHEELENKETVSADPVDDDWISRFFSIAEDVASDELKMLWGRVLAGEITEPSSYSLRTLEVLKNMTKKEAELFSKIAIYSIQVGDNGFIYDEHRNLPESSFPEDVNITYDDILELESIGLINSYPLTFQFDDEVNPVTIKCLDKQIITNVTNAKHKGFDHYLLTRIGVELLNFIDEESPIDYLIRFASKVSTDGLFKIYKNTTLQNGEKIQEEIYRSKA